MQHLMRALPLSAFYMRSYVFLDKHKTDIGCLSGNNCLEYLYYVLMKLGCSKGGHIDGYARLCGGD